MKNLIVFLLLSSLFFTAFSQISSSDLMKKRDKEIKATNKENVAPKLKQAAIAAIDSFYMPLVREAIKNESTSGTKISEEKNLLGETSLSYYGDKGNFSSRNSSVKNSASAYATVATADANAYFVRSMAEKTKIQAEENSAGLEGLIINRYSYQELTVKIEKTDVKSIPSQTFLLGRNQTLQVYLLPGSYKATVKGERDNTPSETYFTVSPIRTHNIRGQYVFWAVWGGVSQ